MDIQQGCWIPRRVCPQQCINSCRYCDFRVQHTGTVRRNLTLDEIRAEAEAGIAGPLLTTPGADFNDDRELALRAGYAVGRGS